MVDGPWSGVVVHGRLKMVHLKQVLWSMVIKMVHHKMVHGRWSLVAQNDITKWSRWSMVDGAQKSILQKKWSMVDGRWSMVT
jgi:hypothetical protein